VKKLIIASLAVAVLLLACGEEETLSPGYPTPTSPAAALKDVEISFNQRNTDLLELVLSPEFVFHFDPRDVGRRPPGVSQYVIPESWTRTEFLRAAAKMFKKAYRISLSIETGSVGEPRPEETEYRAENVPAELLVMIDDLNGFIADSASTFEFERYLAEGGSKHWRLTEWQDRGRYYDEAPAALRPTTLGSVLAVFYTI